MCDSNEEEPKKIDLQNENLDDININLNDKEKIIFKFKNSEWFPSENKAASNNKGENEEEEDEENEDEQNEDDKKKIEELKKETEDRETKKEALNKKKKEIEDKIELMKKILNIDVSEQQYVKDISGQKQKLKSENE